MLGAAGALVFGAAGVVVSGVSGHISSKFTLSVYGSVGGPNTAPRGHPTVTGHDSLAEGKGNLADGKGLSRRGQR